MKPPCNRQLVVEIQLYKPVCQAAHVHYYTLRHTSLTPREERRILVRSKYDSRYLKERGLTVNRTLTIITISIAVVETEAKLKSSSVVELHLLLNDTVIGERFRVVSKLPSFKREKRTEKQQERWRGGGGGRGGYR